MSPIIEFLIKDGTISEQIILILLFLPIIGVIIGIARYYIGIKTFSLYTPIILSSAFFLIYENSSGNQGERLLSGILIGTFYTTLVLTFAAFGHKIFEKLRLHYFPKISLIYSFTIIFVLLVIVGLKYLDIDLFTSINLLSLIMISLSYEGFINVYTKKKGKVAIQLSIETILLSLVCFTLMTIVPVQQFILKFPWIIILTLPANYIIGSFRGLRLNEYLRFRDILEQDIPKDENN